ncbi:MAG: tetratricopeptide repeat protein [Deltaproteobacteria bacterium]|nr:tetratricopeptide repeat protein [Deltaproteobacteria bacterium]
MAQFEEVEEGQAPKKSKTPLIIGGVVAVAAVAGFLATRGSGAMSAEEKAAFQEAQDVLRLDDYNRYGEGEKKLLAVLQKHPDHVEPTVWLIQLYCAWGEELDAEADTFRMAAQSKLKEIGDLKKITETSKSKSAREKAKTQYEAAKKELDELQNAANIRNKSSVEKLKAAKDWVKVASATDYSDAALHRAMADYGRITGKWGEAETQLQYVQKLKPDSAGLRFVKGVIALQRDQKPDDAVALYDEALKIDPKFVKAKYFKGLALAKKGDNDKAAATMKEVLVESPGHTGAKAFLGLVGTLAQARKVAEEAAKAGTADEQVAAGDEAEPAKPAQPAK